MHGPRLIADPLTEKQIKAGRVPRWRPNPASAIPADAIAVTEAQWRELLELQGQGKTITVFSGRVLAAEPARPSAEDQLAAIRARRDRLLVATDAMVSVPDFPITPGQRDEVVAWRQALRDFPDAIAPRLPLDVVDWPARPSWLGENGELL